MIRTKKFPPAAKTVLRAFFARKQALLSCNSVAIINTAKNESGAELPVLFRTAGRDNDADP
ncbi:MAG: hypothetical protein IKK08_07685 [Clostridia bacterium]|nr:hypothetical protein [Clostridia bacterium]